MFIENLFQRTFWQMGQMGKDNCKGTWVSSFPVFFSGAAIVAISDDVV